MDIENADRKIIVKPVASRPSGSNFSSFSLLLAGVINVSPPNAYSKKTISAIRPKTLRFKPKIDNAPQAVISSQGEISGTAVCCLSHNVMEPEKKSHVVYKPAAKLVSRTTASILENLGNFNVGHQKIPFLDQKSVNPDLKSSPLVATNLTTDGYNWRKYGQKQVKGSHNPRSYYKCTNPNCPMKKKVERSYDGNIAETVYKGEYNHSRPQPPRRQLSGTREKGFVSDMIHQDSGNLLWINPKPVEDRTKNLIEVGLSSVHATTYLDKALYCDPITTAAFSNGVRITDNSCGLSGDCEEGSRGLIAEDIEPKCKRRKNGHQSNEISTQGVGVQQPRVLVQNSTDSKILGDGFRWRKYGQKIVKGNPYLRCYYKCTNADCNMRKYVERASDDPKAFITTYEGKHNHEMPVTGKLNRV